MSLEQRKALVDHYIFAKDNNKPHRINDAFTESAALTMVVNTEAIDFPAQTHSRDAISQVLVKDFNSHYDNTLSLIHI